LENDVLFRNLTMMVFIHYKMSSCRCYALFQQAEVIRERTGFQVGHYCGEMGQDFWDARRWQREFEAKQVGFLILVRYDSHVLL
jgi:hypothetical protein